MVCGVPASLPAAALRQGDQVEPVDLQKSRDQHEQYVKVSEGTAAGCLIRIGQDKLDLFVISCFCMCIRGYFTM